MIDHAPIYFLFLKDFADKFQDRYFINEENSFTEITAAQLVEIEVPLITHDYWLIAPSIFASQGKLPKLVIDVTHFSKIYFGKRMTKENGQSTDINALVKPFYAHTEDLKNYFSIFYLKKPFIQEIYLLFSHNLANCWEKIKRECGEKDEWNRYCLIELPIFNLMTSTAVRGIRLDKSALKKIKDEINSDFYRSLKTFSLNFDMNFEVPEEAALKDILSEKGYDVTDASVDFILEFMPMVNDFGKNVIELQKLAQSRQTLATISVSKDRVCPIAETHATVTSRIYYKSPTLQNISKKNRNIFIADESYELAYIDYDQFEVGIMAALSADSKLAEIYSNADVYTRFSVNVFGTDTKRDLSKKLFLSYTYGMKQKNIAEAIYAHGGNKQKAAEFFEQFTLFSAWRDSVADEFEKRGRIGTSLGNYLERIDTGPLSPKERRSCVSQVVQGTGSLIFKTALLKLKDEPSVDILIPMHDAALVQHKMNYDKSNLVRIFQDVMTTNLLGRINGKASLKCFHT